MRGDCLQLLWICGRVKHIQVTGFFAFTMGKSKCDSVDLCTYIKQSSRCLFMWHSGKRCWQDGHMTGFCSLHGTRLRSEMTDPEFRNFLL